MQIGITLSAIGMPSDRVEMPTGRDARPTRRGLPGATVATVGTVSIQILLASSRGLGPSAALPPLAPAPTHPAAERPLGWISPML